MLAVLSGGTGSVKLIRGLVRATTEEIIVISNIGDNFWHLGLYVCPDIDTVTYCLASELDPSRGWGLKKDTFNTLSRIRRLGGESWFRLGDRDLATHMLRTQMLREGRTLTEVTAEICRRLGVRQQVLPASNHSVETWVTIQTGRIHLQEYWVKRGGWDDVLGVAYVGSEAAEPSPGVVESVLSARGVILCPANPITSIGPILSVKGVRRALEATEAVRVAVSPIIGNAPVSGPASKLMAGVGVEVSPVGVARLYSGLVDVFLADDSDRQLEDGLRDTGVTPVFAGILMRTPAKERALAGAVLEAVKSEN